MGGEMMSRQLIENYPGFAEGIMGPDLATAMLEQAGNAGAEVETGEVEGIEEKKGYLVVKTDDGSLTCKGVIIASGSHPRLLNVPGEKELAHKGVFYCATCDGALCAGKSVVVRWRQRYHRGPVPGAPGLQGDRGGAHGPAQGLPDPAGSGRGEPQHRGYLRHQDRGYCG